MLVALINVNDKGLAGKEELDWEGEIKWEGTPPQVILFHRLAGNTQTYYRHNYTRHVDAENGENGKIVHYYRPTSGLEVTV